MKKNKFLVIASVVVVLCLITTCAFSTTLAKYVTGDSGSDSARVAKWGIEVSASGTLFGKNYGAHSAGDNADEIVAYVSESVSASDNVVAPGTKNDTGFQVKISGTPEVSYSVYATADANNEDIYLASGYYGMMVEQTGLNAASDVVGLYTLSGTTYTKVTAGAWDSATTYYALNDYVFVNGRYYPVVWDVNGVEYNRVTNAAGAMVSNLGKLNVAAGTDSANTQTLTWEWSFEGNNGADTVLGNFIAAKGNMVKLNNNDIAATEATAITYSDNKAYCGTDVVANLDVYFGIEVRVEQVD